MRNQGKQGYKLMDKVLSDFSTSPIQRDSTLYIQVQNAEIIKSILSEQ